MTVATEEPGVEQEVGRILARAAAALAIVTFGLPSAVAVAVHLSVASASSAPGILTRFLAGVASLQDGSLSWATQYWTAIPALAAAVFATTVRARRITALSIALYTLLVAAINSYEVQYWSSLRSEDLRTVGTYLSGNLEDIIDDLKTLVVLLKNVQEVAVAFLAAAIGSYVAMRKPSRT